MQAPYMPLSSGLVLRGLRAVCPRRVSGPAIASRARPEMKTARRSLRFMGSIGLVLIPLCQHVVGGEGQPQAGLVGVRPDILHIADAARAVAITKARAHGHAAA